MLQAIEQVVAQRALEEVQVGGGIGNPPAGDRFRQFEQILAVDGDAAGIRPHHAPERFGEGFRAARVRADDRNRLVRLDFDRNVIDQLRTAVVADRKAGDDDRRCKPGDVFDRHFLDTVIDQRLDVELLVDLLILDLHVLAHLVPVDQFLQRPRQVLVGADHGNQLADVETTLQREIAADRVEQERGDLGQEVVDELDQEFPLIEVVADREDQAEPRGNIGALEVRRVVAVDRADAVDDLADTP
jgi:hypothetical protein